MIKIEDMSVRVAFAQDRHKAKNVALEFVAFAVGMDQPLASQLRGGVERRLDRKGMILGRRDEGGLPIDRAGRSEGNGFYSIRAHRLQYVEGGESILLKVLAGMIQAETHIGIGRQVNDGVAAVHGGGQRREIEIIAANQLEPGILARSFQNRFMARRELIPADNL